MRVNLTITLELNDIWNVDLATLSSTRDLSQGVFSYINHTLHDAMQNRWSLAAIIHCFEEAEGKRNQNNSYPEKCQYCRHLGFRTLLWGRNGPSYFQEWCWDCWDSYCGFASLTNQYSLQGTFVVSFYLFLFICFAWWKIVFLSFFHNFHPLWRVWTQSASKHHRDWSIIF